jgi:hypothetical protein
MEMEKRKGSNRERQGAEGIGCVLVKDVLRGWTQELAVTTVQ